MGLTSVAADIGCGGWCCGVCFFFVVVGANGGRWLILWGWSVIVGYGGWFVGVGSGGFCVCIYIYICKSFFLDYFNVLDILF